MSGRSLLRFTIILSAAILLAHEGGRVLRPTSAQRELDRARKLLDIAKRKLTADGHYGCCVRPGCDLCAEKNGSCACARNAAGGGVCGECLAGWKAGRGSVKGLKASDIKLMPAANQACHRTTVAASELNAAAEALLEAKKKLVAEKRYACCIRGGGCSQCAHEADCPCGSDLASSKSKGVCGHCLDGWHSNSGAFRGIPLSEIVLAPMDSSAGMAQVGGGLLSSGTSQTPTVVPLDMLTQRLGSWNLMLHGVIFATQTVQTGPRGRDKVFSTNWFMPSAARRLGPGTLTLRAMLSLEPATITQRRYPLLFQSGETAYGIPIINGQHPHELFMELGALYQIPLGERTSLHFYAAPRGEPALGAPAFPHRASASENPAAVLSHHYQDSTHISTNVVTAGISHGPVTIEASGFHGREPDEKRWGMEGGGINSFSTRITVSPDRNWSGQFSAARINNRESTHPVRDTFRTSSSLIYARPVNGGHWASTLVWGRNVDLEFTQPASFGDPFASLPSSKDNRRFHRVPFPTRIPRQVYNSYLAESTLRFRRRNWIWGRFENVDRDSYLLYEEEPFVTLVEEQRFARVQAYTAGYERELPVPESWLTAGIGAQIMLYGVPDTLKHIYGKRPLGMQFFLRFRLRSDGQ